MAHRKIDIDAFDEDRLNEEDLYYFATGDTPRSPAEIDASVRTTEQEVRALLSRGNHSDALIKALQNPPYGPCDKSIKLRAVQTVYETLSQFPPADASTAVKQLSREQQDLLMKYLYAGMAAPEHFNSALLLTWHEKLTEVAGNGCIVRVFTDRRTVF
ncbi:uncharacterized protein VTP21DRAFT_5004 [Calcarisporiella thermophila]|uniref:uncharacterized protein n=1 Tax=Calcarisporiella thermophila TaxID=911321 RepID=UPI0037439A99